MSGVKYRPATRKDIGRLARFADRDGDDWSYGKLSAFDGEFFAMTLVDGDEPEEWFAICQVEELDKKCGAE